MLPRLEAQDQFKQMQVRTATNERVLEPADHRRLLSQLEEQVSGGRKRRPPKATPEMLARMGVGVRSEPGSKGGG